MPDAGLFSNVDTIIPKTLCLFSGGKDSAMALLHEIDSGKKCIALIAECNSHAQLSDGPEVDVEMVKAIAEKIFHVETITCNTTDENYKDELVETIDNLILNNKINRIVTGDLNHPDGIIHYLKNIFKERNRDVSFFSIGEKYIDSKGFMTQKYLDDVITSLSLKIVGIRLPDFANVENMFLGRDFDRNKINELTSRNIDPLGEDGEYQSLTLSHRKSNREIIINDSEIRVQKGRDTKNYTYMMQEIKSWEILTTEYDNF